MVITNGAGPALGKGGQLFEELCTQIPHGKLTGFLDTLGFEYTDVTNIHVEEKRQNCAKTVRHFLEAWEKKGEATKDGLNNALRKNHLGSLCEIVDKHFAQGNALSSDVNTMNRPNSGVTGTNHQRRPDVHNAMSTTAGQIPPSVQQQSQEQEVVSPQTEKPLLGYRTEYEINEGERHERRRANFHVSGREWIKPLTIAVGAAAIAFFIYKGYTHKA